MRALTTVAIVLTWPALAAAEPCDGQASPKRDDTVQINCTGHTIPGLRLRNWKSNTWYDNARRVAHFHRKHARPISAITQFTIHETANSSVLGTELHLLRNRLGVHFIIDRKGRVSHHNDLTDATQHDRRNNASVGVELVNRIYVPKRRPGRTIIGRWTTNTVHHYQVPTMAQVEALHVLTRWLTSKRSGLNIPRRFAGITKRRHESWFTFSHHQPLPSEGVRAHGHMKLKFRGKVVGRSDGFFPALYVWLRMNKHVSPKRAYWCARRITNGARLRQWTNWQLANHDDDLVWRQVRVRGILGKIVCPGGR